MRYGPIITCLLLAGCSSNPLYVPEQPPPADPMVQTELPPPPPPPPKLETPKKVEPPKQSAAGEYWLKQIQRRQADEYIIGGIDCLQGAVRTGAMMMGGKGRDRIGAKAASMCFPALVLMSNALKARGKSDEEIKQLMAGIISRQLNRMSVTD